MPPHLFNPVISKFITTANNNVMNWVNNLANDIDTVLINGPFGQKLLKTIWPEFNRLQRQEKVSEVPQDLLNLERKFAEYRDKPKSVYSFKLLTEMYSSYETEIQYPSWYDEYSDPWSTFIENVPYENPWCQSAKFEFDTTGLDLSKGAGMPSMGPKRINLNSALLYANKIKADQSTPAFAFLPGFRTQIDKTRGIWQDPMSEWCLEVEAFRDAILKT